jgi:NAD(P)-dependent dehydrogenase (short-subunit alcohol dehydrogenase family)
MNADEFAGMSAVVTGAASGIGREVVRMVARHGGDVGCLDLNGEGLSETAALVARESPDRVIRTVVGDASSARDVESALETFSFARIDLLFNVAGMITSKPLLACDSEDLATVMRVNVGTVLTMTAAVAPRMTAGGVVVNTSSTSAFRVIKGGGLYGASKNAVVYLTRCLANELSGQNIRVCAVGPGAVDTPMPRGLLASLGVSDPDETFRRGTEAAQLIPGPASAAEIAQAMGFLASRDARYCTGTTLWVDGGKNAQ